VAKAVLKFRRIFNSKTGNSGEKSHQIVVEGNIAGDQCANGAIALMREYMSITPEAVGAWCEDIHLIVE
jgi:hypothetical protein